MTSERIEMANGWYWVPFRSTDSVDRGCGGWLMRPDGQALASMFGEDARAFAASLQQQEPQAPAARNSLLQKMILDIHEALGLNWGDNIYSEIDRLKAIAFHQPQALAAGKPQVPDGWKLVPIRPTRLMIEVCRDGVNRLIADEVVDIWGDMLAAAPISGSEP